MSGAWRAGLETSRIVTIDYLEFHAQQQPDAIALIDRGREIRYGEMIRDLAKVAPALQAFNLPQGSSVAIGCDDFYLHWLLILGFERLGVATTSFHSREGAGVRGLLGTVDLVLAEGHYPTGGWQTRSITEEWLAAVWNRPDERLPPAAPALPEGVLRIVRTSGTTGEPKRFHLLRRMLEAWLRQAIWLNRAQKMGARVLLTMPFSIGATYGITAAVLRAGDTVVYEPWAGAAELPGLIARHGLNRVTLLPVQLKQVLERLPADWVKPASLEITCFGARVPDELRALALDRLATLITEIYGSNEMGGVSVLRRPSEDGFASICPEIEVEIVDEEDNPLPDGIAGLIRVRTEGCLRAYLDDPTLTRRMLRGGWFYPGDLGVRDGRRLLLIGRADDQVNIGGVKYALPRLEELVQKSAGSGVLDVGIVSVPDGLGIPALNVALVTDGKDDRAVIDRVAATLRRSIAGDLHLVRLPQIPRNEMGKIDRAQLKDAIVAARFPKKG